MDLFQLFILFKLAFLQPSLPQTLPLTLSFILSTSLQLPSEWAAILRITVLASFQETK